MDPIARVFEAAANYLPLRRVWRSSRTCLKVKQIVLCRRFLVVAVAGLLFTPLASASADHLLYPNLRPHWAGDGVRTVVVLDTVAAALPADELRPWRRARDSALAHWALDGVSLFQVSEEPATTLCDHGKLGGSIEPGFLKLCIDPTASTSWAWLSVDSDDHLRGAVAAFTVGAIHQSRSSTERAICHEVGHTFGLDHRDDAGYPWPSCLNLAIGGLWPDAHDLELVRSFHDHSDV